VVIDEFPTGATVDISFLVMSLLSLNWKSTLSLALQLKGLLLLSFRRAALNVDNLVVQG